MDIYVLILPLLIGWILDKLLGDPVGLPHPVVGFGKLISFCEKRWNCGAHGMLNGGGAAILLILVVYVGDAW
ncbi:MAG: cobalamin biosynthesis protein, partial [Phocaeicola dorei]|nr:cobalamin biosynthesis protein [Phocaeicola dorei]